MSVRSLLVCCLAVLSLGVAAQSLSQPGAQLPGPDSDLPARIASERQRIEAERGAAEQAHDALMRDCWQRFAVNDCLREVRRKRYAALDPLRAQELELNAQERAWRTLQREERLRDKQTSGEKAP